MTLLATIGSGRSIYREEREREVWRVRNLAARSTNLDVRLTRSEVTLACLSPHASSEGGREREEGGFKTLKLKLLLLHLLVLEFYHVLNSLIAVVHIDGPYL